MIMMRQFLNIIITRLKKENFQLDSRIPVSYILGIALEKFIDRIYAIIRLRRFDNIFLSPCSVIKCPSKIKLNGSTLVIARGCYIDALSINGIIFGGGLLA